MKTHTLDALTISVEAAAKALGISRSSAYAAVGTGEIPSVRIGNRIVVPTAPIRRMLGLDDATTP